MVSWKKVLLGDVITLKRGHDLPENKRVDGMYPVYSSSGITGFHDKYISDNPGVITGRYGSIGNVFYTDRPYWPLNTTLYVEKFNDNIQKFIYYLLKTIDWNAFTVAGAVPGINRNHIHQYLIDIPDLPTQEMIADTLSAFDDKISLNNKINDYLAA